MSTTIRDLEKLCVHTITTKPLDFRTACETFADMGIKGISIWRDAVEGIPSTEVKKCLKDHGLSPVSYVRGGFFPSVEEEKRKAAIQDNVKMLEEASAMDIPLLVLVCGSEPRQPLKTSREQIMNGIEAILPEAKNLGVKLAIEPLHPMYADTRSAITTLKQANDMSDLINDDSLGIAVDVYHVWFDEDLEEEICRCGRNNKLFAFHICDWNVPTTDMLLDRGLMGDGCIPVGKIRKWVEKAGFSGFNEVEIFSEKYWAMDQHVFLEKIVDAYIHHS